MSTCIVGVGVCLVLCVSTLCSFVYLFVWGCLVCTESCFIDAAFYAHLYVCCGRGAFCDLFFCFGNAALFAHLYVFGLCCLVFTFMIY